MTDESVDFISTYQDPFFLFEVKGTPINVFAVTFLITKTGRSKSSCLPLCSLPTFKPTEQNQISLSDTYIGLRASIFFFNSFQLSKSFSIVNYFTTFSLEFLCRQNYLALIIKATACSKYYIAPRIVSFGKDKI